MLAVIALLSAAHQVQGIQVTASASNLDSSSSDAKAAASLKDRFLHSSASAQDLLAAKEPAQLDDISHGQESLAAASLKDRFLRSSASTQDLLAAKEPVQFDDISHGQESLVAPSGPPRGQGPAQLDDVAHGQESLVAPSGDSSSSDAEAAASLKDRFLRSSASAQDPLAAKEPAQLDDVAHGQESPSRPPATRRLPMPGRGLAQDRFLRSSASAQDLLAAKEPAQLDDISHGQESLDLLAAKEPAQLDDISHGQESLVAPSGDSSSSDAEAAASLKDRFLRSSASAQDLLAAKEPAQLDDVAHGQESLVAPSGDSSSSDAEAAASLKDRFLRSSASAQDLLAAKEPAQLDDISHGQESLVALSGDSSSSDAEAAASLKDRFLRSSASAQDLLAAKEPVQFDDVAHGQESLVALSGDSSSSDAEAAASLKDRFLRSSASAQDLLAAKEPAQLDDVAHGQESLVALSGDSSSSDAEAAASLKDRFLRSSTQDILARSGGGTDMLVVVAAAVAGALVAVLICFCIKRRRPKAAAARADVNVEAPPDRNDAFAGDGLEARSVKWLKAEAQARGVSLVGCVKGGHGRGPPRGAARAGRRPADSWNVAAAQDSASRRRPSPAPPMNAGFAAEPLAVGARVAYARDGAARLGVVAAVYVEDSSGPYYAPKDVLNSVEKYWEKVDDVKAAGATVVDVLTALNQMSENVEKFQRVDQDQLKTQIDHLKLMLRLFKGAVDEFGKEGWYKRAWTVRGTESLVKLDKEIREKLKELDRSYGLVRDAENNSRYFDTREWQFRMETKINKLIEDRCASGRCDVPTAVAFLVNDPDTLKIVAADSHVTEDVLKEELAKISNQIEGVRDEMQGGFAGVHDKVEGVHKKMTQLEIQMDAMLKGRLKNDPEKGEEFLKALNGEAPMG
ncbi:N,N-dimethylaniline monooxygenase [Aureococcus anophagefferens]|nr:N,N-dimethylaniline monooxygenase [Aureococcus anophagefferens]